MYLVPQEFKCIKCGHSFVFSPSVSHSAPTTTDGNPVCPKCWDAFLHTVGVGYCTMVWNANGSEYDQALKRKQNDGKQCS